MSEQADKPQSKRKERRNQGPMKEGREKATKAMLDRIDRNNGVAGELKDFRVLLKAYTDKTSNDHKAAMDAIKELQRERLASGKNITRYAKKKSGLKDLTSIKAWMREQGIQPIPSDRILWDLIALDDWGTILNLAKPLLATLGGKAFDWVWKKLTHKEPIGGDEGFNSIDWPSNPALQPARVTLMPGVNVEQRGMVPAASRSTDIYTVNANAIKSVLCPELFKHRYTYMDNIKTALAVPVTEVSIVSSAAANGQVGVIVLPKAYKSDGGSAGTALVTVYQDTTFNVATGSQSVATSSWTAGPLYNNLAMISSSRVVGAAVQFIPTASMNTAGSFTMCHNPRSSASSLTNLSLGINLQTAKTQPYVTSFNNKTTARMLALFQDATDENLNYNEQNIPSNWIVLLGSGLPTATEVGRVVVSLIIEYVPSPLYFHMCVVDYPTTGPSTEAFEGVILSHYPVLQSLDLVDAKKVCDAIPDGTQRAETITTAISTALTGIQPRLYHSHTENTAPISYLRAPVIMSDGSSAYERMSAGDLEL